MAILTGDFTSVSQSTNASWVDWVDIDNLVDSTSSNYTYVELPVITTTPKFSEDLLIENHTIDSTRSDYVFKVEFGITYKSDADQNWLEEYQAVDKYFVGIFENEVEGITTEYQEIPIEKDNYNTYWIDITNLIITSSFTGWEWSHIKDLRASFYTASNDQTSSFTINLYNVKIRITTSDTPRPIIGLRCYDSTGNITLSESDSISRVLYQEKVSSTSSGSKKVYKDYYTTIVAYAQSLESGKLPHTVTRNGSGSDVNGYYELWSWSPNSFQTSLLPPSDSLIIIMGY